MLSAKRPRVVGYLDVEEIRNIAKLLSEVD